MVTGSVNEKQRAGEIKDGMNNRKGLLPLRTASYDLLYHVSGGRGRT